MGVLSVGEWMCAGVAGSVVRVWVCVQGCVCVWVCVRGDRWGGWMCMGMWGWVGGWVCVPGVVGLQGWVCLWVGGVWVSVRM